MDYMRRLALAKLQIKGTDKLVFQRRDDRAPTSPNMLGFFGGHLDDPSEETVNTFNDNQT